MTEIITFTKMGNEGIGMKKDLLAKEFKYYLKNQEELAKEYNGKYIVIKDEKVLGSFNTIAEAYNDASAHHKVGTFLIQLVSPGNESHIRTFHSRVSFAQT